MASSPNLDIQTALNIRISKVLGRPDDSRPSMLCRIIARRLSQWNSANINLKPPLAEWHRQWVALAALEQRAEFANAFQVLDGQCSVDQSRRGCRA